MYIPVLIFIIGIIYATKTLEKMIMKKAKHNKTKVRHHIK